MPMKFIVAQAEFAVKQAEEEARTRSQRPMPITQEQVDTIFKLHEQGHSFNEISRRTGILVRTISRRIKSGDRKGSDWAIRAPEYYERAMELREKGFRWIDVAAELGINDATLRRIRRRFE